MRMRLLMKLKETLGALSPNCREAVRLQSEQMDHPLGWWQRLGLKVHLMLCTWCRRYGRQLRFLRSASQNQPEEPPAGVAQGMPPAVRERLAERLRNAGK